MNRFQFAAIAVAALTATVGGAAPVGNNSNVTIPSVPVTVTNAPVVTAANPITLANPVAVSGTVNAAISSVVSVQSAFPRTPVIVPLTGGNVPNPTDPLYVVPVVRTW